MAGGADNQNLGPATLSAANILTIEIERGTETTVDLSPLAGGGGGVNQNLAQVLALGNDANTLGITNLTTDDTDLTAAATVGYVNSVATGGGSTEVADQTTITGIGTDIDPFTIEPSANLGQYLRRYQWRCYLGRLTGWYGRCCKF